MNKIILEAIGIIATLLILVAMCFKTTSLKGAIWLRALNMVGSIVFVVYGCLLPAYSTAVLNAALILVNAYHLVILIKTKNRQ